MSKGSKQGKAKRLLGTVVSANMNNSVVISIERSVMHDLYRKFRVRSKTVKAKSSLANSINVGDIVEIQECRPLAADTRFFVTQIVRSSPSANTVNVVG